MVCRVGGKNILWRTTLPEGGQSAVTIQGDRAFVTTHRPMDESSDRLEPNLVGYCLDANTGRILWTVDLPGTDPVQTAGIFSDATVFAPIADGEHVWFFNRCGSMGCFDFDGRPVWLRDFRPLTRHTNRQCEPILVGDKILTVEVRNKEAGAEGGAARAGARWRRTARCLDLPARDRQEDRRHRLGRRGRNLRPQHAHGRAVGGRAPGGGAWTGRRARSFGEALRGEHDSRSTRARRSGAGKSTANARSTRNGTRDMCSGFREPTTSCSTARRARSCGLKMSRAKSGPHRRGDRQTRDRASPSKVGKRMPLTNQTNIVVGDWHYFLAHDITAIGRVHIETGKTEYLRVPAQFVAGAEPKRSGRRATPSRMTRRTHAASTSRPTNAPRARVGAMSPPRARFWSIATCSSPS
jgi:hypothetical protein